MTARHESMLPARNGTRDYAWPKAATAFTVTLLALVLFATATAAGYVRFLEDRVLPGVTVAGVDVGGLPATEAEARLREHLPSMASGTLTLEVADERTVIPYTDIGRDYDMAPMVDRALAYGRPEGNLLTTALEHLRVLHHGANVAAAVALDPDELTLRVLSVAAAAEVEAVDAALVRRGATYAIVPAKFGQATDGEEGVRLATAALYDLTPDDAHVSIPTQRVVPAVVTADAAQALESYEAIVRRPLTVESGDTSATLASRELRGWTRLEPEADGGWSAVVDEAAIAQFAEQFAAEADVEPRDARLVFEGGEVAAVAGVVGVIVDVPATTDALLTALHARTGPIGQSYTTGTGPPTAGGPLQAAAVITEPELTTEEAEELAESMERLSRWRTRYPRGVLNFHGANVDIPTEAIHETVLLPGERFDFWDVVGFPSRADGYGPGGAIINGEMVLDGVLAGGICAVSTTVFNAALRAGLETGARRSHHFHLDRYPLGLDATVWINRNGHGTTVRFTNDMDQPVIIRGIGRRNAVIFEVWGVPDGRDVRISRARVQDRGSTYDVWRTRTVTDANGDVIHNDTYHSRYAWPTD